MEERFSGSLLYRVVSEQLKFKTTYYEREITLTGGVDKILKLNPRRLSFLVVNRTSGLVDVGFRPDLPDGAGIILGGNGGALHCIWTEDGELVGSDVYARGNAGGKLYILEVVGFEKGGKE